MNTVTIKCMFVIIFACIIVSAHARTKRCKKGECYNKDDDSCVKKGKDEENCVKNMCRRGKLVKQKYYGCKTDGSCLKFKRRATSDCSVWKCIKNGTSDQPGILFRKKYTGCRLEDGSCLPFGKDRSEETCMESICKKKKKGFFYKSVPIGCRPQNSITCLPFGRVQNETSCTSSICEKTKTGSSYKEEPLGCLVEGKCYKYGATTADCMTMTCTKVPGKEKANFARVPAGCVGADGGCYGDGDGPFAAVMKNGKRYENCSCKKDGSTFQTSCSVP